MTPKSIYIALIIIALLAIIYGVVVGALCLQADQRLSVLNYVLESARRFILLNGTWPQSWNDLQRGSSARLFEDPHEENNENAWAVFKSLVEVDFTMMLEDIAKDDARVYQAIKPNGICYNTESTKRRYQSLVDAARFKIALSWMD